MTQQHICREENSLELSAAIYINIDIDKLTSSLPTTYIKVSYSRIGTIDGYTLDECGKCAVMRCSSGNGSLFLGEGYRLLVLYRRQFLVRGSKIVTGIFILTGMHDGHFISCGICKGAGLVVSLFMVVSLVGMTSRYSTDTFDVVSNHSETHGQNSNNTYIYVGKWQSFAGIFFFRCTTDSSKSQFLMGTISVPQRCNTYGIDNGNGNGNRKIIHSSHVLPNAVFSPIKTYTLNMMATFSRKPAKKFISPTSLIILGFMSTDDLHQHIIPYNSNNITTQRQWSHYRTIEHMIPILKTGLQWRGTIWQRSLTSETWHHMEI
ncbi:hypothetical protein BCR42DRAFT_397978 [Absidia repens]|uniref:Uncharacterized protein n=1 Tax=Absidia repens TaxID=90262 RepID=A0A1X2HZJ0_9FUNG|nr:hypothetical protein BCR42DRAFT_397978 [Absidia repens]